MRDHVAESTGRTRFAMTLLVLFAGVAGVLAVIGIYGVFAYSVGERKRESGVRLALGAVPVRIIGQFVRSKPGKQFTEPGPARACPLADLSVQFVASRGFKRIL